MPVKKIVVHAFLDGRDTPPRSAAQSLELLQDKCDELGVGRIATICGRFFAMDRDNRWERVQIAYDMLTQDKAPFSAATAADGLELAYARGENDEFVQATRNRRVRRHAGWRCSRIYEFPCRQSP